MEYPGTRHREYKMAVKGAQTPFLLVMLDDYWQITDFLAHLHLYIVFIIFIYNLYYLKI